MKIGRTLISDGLRPGSGLGHPLFEKLRRPVGIDVPLVREYRGYLQGYPVGGGLAGITPGDCRRERASLGIAITGKFSRQPLKESAEVVEERLYGDIGVGQRADLIQRLA